MITYVASCSHRRYQLIVILIDFVLHLLQNARPLSALLFQPSEVFSCHRQQSCCLWYALYCSVVEIIRSAVFLPYELILAYELQINHFKNICGVFDKILVGPLHGFERVLPHFSGLDRLFGVWQWHLDGLFEFTLSHYVDMGSRLVLSVQEAVHLFGNGLERLDYFLEVWLSETFEKGQLFEVW